MSVAQNGLASTSAKAQPTAGKSSSGKPIETVTAILDRLDAIDDTRFRNRRIGERTSFRRTAVPIRISHPGGSRSSAAVATRNLSASGIGFLLDRFLHNGTRIEIVLRRLLDNAPDLLVGKVVFCMHVGGASHQVGVRFDTKIFPSLYYDPAQPD